MWTINENARESSLVELRDTYPQKSISLQNVSNKSRKTQTSLGKIQFQFEH